MDFKSHEEYVLPREKGAGKSPKEQDGSKPEGLGEPRSYKRPGQPPVLAGAETPTEGIPAPREFRDDDELPQLHSSRSPEASGSVHDAIDEAVRKIDAVNDDLNRERELESHEEIEAETMSISDDWIGMAGAADTSSVPTDRVPDVVGCSTATLDGEEEACAEAEDEPGEAELGSLEASDGDDDDDDDLDVLEEVSKQISQLASKESSKDAPRQLDDEEPDDPPIADEDSQARPEASVHEERLDDDEPASPEPATAAREDDAASCEVRRRPKLAGERTTATTSASKPRESAPAATRSRRSPSQDSADISDFIIAYDGHFLGSYRSFRRITHRTAFIRTAQRLKESIDDFDIEKLELFKPTPVNVEPQDVVNQLDEEEFSWFGA